MQPKQASLATRIGMPAVQPQPRPTVASAQADQSKLDAQRLAERVKELTQPNIVRPALIDPAEVELARQKFKTDIAVLAAIEAMADIRLSWLNIREGLKPIVVLSPGQKESAMNFFTTHPDKPLVEAPVSVATPAPAPQAPAAPPSQPPALRPDYAVATLLAAQTKLLTRIADTLDMIAANTAPAAPNYKRPFADFANFDWATIGAVVTARDDDGVSAVEAGGYDYTRRAGNNVKFGKAIWFSRPMGKDADGNNLYARLVTFKDYTQAEALPKK